MRKLDIVKIILWQVAAALICICHGCGDSPPAGVTNRAGHPTEEEAATNRARLKNVPIQTVGIGPDESWKSIPVETPPAPTVTHEIKIQLNMQANCHVVGEQFVKCPHCGEKIKIEVQPYFVSDNK